MNFKQAFGKQLKTIRKSRKMTQERLSELIGIHPRQVSKIETGEHFPTSTTLENLCIELDATPKELFNFELAGDREYVNTGTGVVYNYKATVKNNVVYLHDIQKNITHAQKATSDEIDEEMFVIAKNINRSVIVQYVYEDGTSKTIEYFPNRTYKVINNKDAEIAALNENIKKLAKDDQYFEFIKLAVGALKNKEDLSKLEMLLAGIKLANKNKK